MAINKYTDNRGVDMEGQTQTISINTQPNAVIELTI